MFSSSSLLSLATIISVVYGHAQILAVQGEAGSPQGVGFQVDTELARNCTSISPCQQDATIIRDAEINSNVVNECGRTEIAGNIDVGENTENALAANQVTQVKAGSKLTVTIHQVNADGAGPFTCDMDPTGNSLGVTGQTALEVTNNVPGVNGFSQAKTQDFNITVTMPTDLNCTGASTGNICTVRCRNNALAGPFGGCFAVQQTDTNVKTNVASKIQTEQTLEGVQAQIQQNKLDLPVAIAGNQVDGTQEQLDASKKVLALGGVSVVSKAAAVQTPAPAASSAASANTGNANTGNNNKGNKGNKNGANAATGNANTANANGNGNGNANANANTANANTANANTANANTNANGNGKANANANAANAANTANANTANANGNANTANANAKANGNSAKGQNDN